MFTTTFCESPSFGLSSNLCHFYLSFTHPNAFSDIMLSLNALITHQHNIALWMTDPNAQIMWSVIIFHFKMEAWSIRWTRCYNIYSLTLFSNLVPFNFFLITSIYIYSSFSSGMFFFLFFLFLFFLFFLFFFFFIFFGIVSIELASQIPIFNLILLLDLENVLKNGILNLPWSSIGDDTLSIITHLNILVFEKDILFRYLYFRYL